MQLVPRDSKLWEMCSDDTKHLLETGETVLQFVFDYKDRAKIEDYSFCVFSFAKAYEGFLKKMFLDVGFIKPHEYYGDDIRIGRILSPSFAEEKSNVFYRICNHPGGGSDLSTALWYAWKNGRNVVFHYFPHNFRKLDYDEAFKTVTMIVDAMVFAAERCSTVEKGLIDREAIQKSNLDTKKKALKSKRGTKDQISEENVKALNYQEVISSLSDDALVQEARKKYTQNNTRSFHHKHK